MRWKPSSAGHRRPSAGRAAPARPVPHPPRMVSTASLRPPALPTRSRTTDDIPRSTAAQPLAALAARILGRADPRLDGILRAPRRRGGDRLSGQRARLGGEAVSASRSYDIVVIGSGAGGGPPAPELAHPGRGGVRHLLLQEG